MSVNDQQQAESKPTVSAPILCGGCRDRSLFEALMDYLPDSIYFKDTKSRFIAVNPAIAEHFGERDPRAMIGKTDFDFFTQEHAERALDDEREILRTGRPLVDFEEKETWPDGHETWVSTTKVLLRDPEGGIMGTFGLSRDVTERKHAEEQLAKFSSELHAKNEALQEELAMARELQYTMLPQRYPRFRDASGTNAINFHHFYQPSAVVSGDFFDVFKISNDVAGIFICDVMGHGVRAALVAATMRALVQEFSAKWTEPAEFLCELNRALRRSLRHARTPLFASAFYMVADLGRGELRYANAGHPRPFHLHFDEAGAPNVTSLAGKTGSVIGLFDDANFQTSHCCLAPRDMLFLFTDGLYEAEDDNGQIYDYDILLQAVQRRGNQSMKDLCQGVLDEVQHFSANNEFGDDVCLVAMEVERLIPTSVQPE
jgi:sigma-B regulation protein RsbU (phosphoserine phosphatase)